MASPFRFPRLSNSLDGRESRSSLFFKGTGANATRSVLEDGLFGPQAPTGIPFRICVSSVWRSGTFSVVNVGGTWRTISSGWIQVAGSWRQISS